jgi:hypothetical protein
MEQKPQELSMDRAALRAVVSEAIANASLTDMSEVAIRAARAFRAGLEEFDKQDGSVLACKNYPPADLTKYVGDDYPRAGCTVVVQLTETTWDWVVYAPGYAPGGPQGVIESRAGRLGSAGNALDAFIRGDKDYASSSGSSVTSNS